MRYLELVLSPGKGLIHPLFPVMADSSFVQGAWMLDWNVTREDTTMALFRIEGDSNRLSIALETEPTVLDYDLSSAEGGEFYASIYSEAIATERQLWIAFNQRQSMLIPPLEYRDGTVTCRIVGTQEELSAAIDEIPSGLKTEIKRVNQFESRAKGVASALTDRQREAVETAIDIGYYRIPREASAADLAGRLNCSPSTASELLRRAESRVITSVFSG
jgi:predicted DNA binding protein